MISDKKMVSAVGAKTARACDYCIRKRASWYCAADDAFLCQSCDRSVHSANQLALRHERVSLKSPSLNHSSDKPSCCIPSWHRGLKRRSRTPRHAKHHNKHNDHHHHESKVGVLRNRPPVVPEIGAEDSTSHEEDTEENQLLYCVPVFKPFVAEMCSSSATSNGFATGTASQASEVKREESKSIQSILLTDDVQDVDSNSPCGFQPSEFTLAEFSIDVDTLLGKGFEGESYGIEELGILDFQERDIKIDLESSMSGSGGGDGGSSSFSSRLRMIKAEEVDGSRGEEMEATATMYHLDTHTDMLQEPFELTFDYDDYPTTISREEEDIKVVTTDPHLVTEEDDRTEEKSENENEKMKILLKLDYEAISKAWASQGSPYMNGERPEMNSDDCWLHSMGACGSEANLPYGEIAMVGTGQAPIGGDGGREARVSRYREKRRTRLFSKKIRYEVRKLNAEKRPRMKSRFVKRSSFTTIPFATV